MEKKFLELCLKVGENIGNAIFEEENFGDLYTLRNCRTLDNFFEALSILTVKYAKKKWIIKIPQEYLENAKRDLWKREKSLTVIFAVNKYLTRKYIRDQKKEGKNND